MQIIATFTLERTTPGTVRYKHEGGDVGIETIYIRKDALKGDPTPERIQIMITPTE